MSCAGEERIEEWRAAELLPGALWNEESERDFPGEPDWFYSRDDLHRILAAANLIEPGLPAERLAETFARFDGACRWRAVILAVGDLEPIFPLRRPTSGVPSRNGGTSASWTARGGSPTRSASTRTSTAGCR